MEQAVLLFAVVFGFVIVQRLAELVVAKRATARLLAAGAVEFGAEHYRLIVVLHTAFFISMLAEFLLTEPHTLSAYSGPLLIGFGLLQIARVWTIRSLEGRWTTRIIVIPNESLSQKGLYRVLAHPNYVIVALEIIVLPLIFGLVITAAVFTVLNTLLLIFVRIPEEEKALRWATAVEGANHGH